MLDIILLLLANIIPIIVSILLFVGSIKTMIKASNVDKNKVYIYEKYHKEFSKHIDYFVLNKVMSKTQGFACFWCVFSCILFNATGMLDTHKFILSNFIIIIASIVILIVRFILIEKSKTCEKRFTDLIYKSERELAEKEETIDGSLS